jgi:hypothetical protein
VAQPEGEQHCPHCGTPYDAGQEYCLECGGQLPESPGLTARLGARWRRRIGWYPGDWIWPTLAALAIAAAAGVLSAVFLADQSSSANGTLVLTNAGSASIPTQTAPELTATTATAQAPTATTSTTQTAPPPPPPAPTLATWPAGRSGWTIVLDSVPTTNGRVGAAAEAKQALRLGLTQVGVIDSGGFSSLHPGYFVVFTGIYGSEAEAQSHIIEAHQHGYRGPYVRRITP